MAKDSSKRPTKRQKTPLSAASAPKVAAPTKKRAAAPRVSLKKKAATAAKPAQPKLDKAGARRAKAP